MWTKKSLMDEVVRNASTLVCFSDTLRNAAWAAWPWKDPNRFFVIPQSVTVSDVPLPLCSTREEVGTKLLREVVMSNYSGGRSWSHVVLLPMGIRRVKDPLFILPALLTEDKEVEEGVDERENVVYVIIGPVLEDAIFSEVKDALLLRNVKSSLHYCPALEQHDLHTLMYSPLVLGVANTSISEGQPQAILEAMTIGHCTVFVRDIPGNVAVVPRGSRRGFVFSSPTEFTQVVRDARVDEVERSIRIEHALRYVHEYHSPEAEGNNYVAAIRHSLKE
eukprot:PhF_6_TR8749/c0_g1_i1/m.13769